MNYYGLLPLGIGIYFELYALGKVGSKNPDYQYWRERLIPFMRWLAPLVVLYGVAVVFRWL